MFQIGNHEHFQKLHFFMLPLTTLEVSIFDNQLFIVSMISFQNNQSIILSIQKFH